MSGINLHIHPSDFRNETRIRKETKSLADGGISDNIVIAAIWQDGLGLDEHQRLDDKRTVWRVRLKTRKWQGNTFCKIIRHIEWAFKIFKRFRKSPVDFVNCHTLSSLPIGILFRIFSKAKVVYDAHELETERNGWSRPRKALAKILERSLIHKTDMVIVVSDSIAQWYKDRYHLSNVHVIRNVPYRAKTVEERSDILKRKFGIGDDELLFIHQGLLGPARGIELLLEVFSQVSRKKHIVFMGHGPLEQTIRDYESGFPNIHFQPAVKPQEILKYTGSCDVGIHLPQNTCLSYYYSLPNKFFEYIVSGLPVIVSDFPEMAKIVDREICGWKVAPDKKAVMELIESISRENIEEIKINVLRNRDTYVWENKEKRLLGAYNDLFGNQKNYEKLDACEVM